MAESQALNYFILGALFGIMAGLCLAVVLVEVGRRTWAKRRSRPDSTDLQEAVHDFIQGDITLHELNLSLRASTRVKQ